MHKRIVPVVVLLVVAAAGTWWWLKTRHRPEGDLVLYGNVDLRQVSLAFADSERIAEVLVQEGDAVKAGQALARLDTGRIAAPPARAGRGAGRRADGKRCGACKSGSRPEEIAQARAACRPPPKRSSRMRASSTSVCRHSRRPRAAAR